MPQSSVRETVKAVRNSFPSRTSTDGSPSATPAAGLVALVLLSLLSPTALAKPTGPQPPAKTKAVPKRAVVTLGVDVLFSDHMEWIAGKRVALITNASGVDGQLRATADRLHRDKRVKLVRLFAPEHGIRGAAPAGKSIEDARDPVTRVPVISLFGEHKQPPPESLEDVDVLIFDIQDIGSRTYTYTTTMARSMRAANKARIPFIVLDRPNPLGGLVYEGPILPRRRYSFIGFGPVPVSHGLTAGELAGFYNVQRKIGCDLRVARMKGWTRDMVWQDTGLEWVMTSPGIPTARAAHHYIATGMIGGVTKNVNEGVGTTLPFELIGAEWLNGPKLRDALNGAGLPGVRFRAITYKPYYHRHRGKMLHGVQIMPYDLRAFRPLRTALTILTTIERLKPKRTRFRSNKYFAIVWGNTDILKAVRAGKSAKEISATWAADTLKYGLQRLPFLLY